MAKEVETSLIGRTCYCRDPNIRSRKGWGILKRMFELNGVTICDVYLTERGTFFFRRDHVRVNRPDNQKPLKVRGQKATGRKRKQVRGAQ